MVRFNFEPETKALNANYQALEKAVNEMNKANDFDTLNHWSWQAITQIMIIHKVNSELIDLNSMGG